MDILLIFELWLLFVFTVQSFRLRISETIEQTSDMLQVNMKKIQLMYTNYKITLCESRPSIVFSLSLTKLYLPLFIQTASHLQLQPESQFTSPMK